MTDAQPEAAAAPRRVIIAGAAYDRTPDPERRAVFATVPRQSSDPRAARHPGLGQVVDWLDPVEPDRARLAWVRLADGALAAAPAADLRPAAGIAARRILPRPAHQRRPA